MIFKLFLRAAICLLALFVLHDAALAQWTPTRQARAFGDLNAVFFADSKRGWVAGDNGFLAFTKDAGESWTQQKVNTKDPISDIYFRSADKGYVIAGEKVFSSTDGGQSWREEQILLSSDVKEGKPELYSLRFANKKKGWIVGSLNKNDQVVGNLVLHTSDGGTLWQRVRVPTNSELIHLDFVDEDNGWIVGANGTIFATNDGGENWLAQKSYTTAALYHVDFKNKDLGWAVGEKGLILRTMNGGATWQKVLSNVPKTLLSVEFTNEENGWIVGRGGVILRSNDGGVSWIKQDSRTTDSLFALYVDKKSGWAVGGKGTILRYEP